MAPITDASFGYKNGTTEGHGGRALVAIGTAIYLVYNTTSTFIDVQKSTDGGATWTLQSSTNAPHAMGHVYAIDATTDGTDLFVAYSYLSNQIRVKRYVCSTDAWDASDIGSGAADNNCIASRGISLEVRSNGTMVLFFIYPSFNDWRQKYWNGTTWGGANSNAVNGFPLGSLIDDADRCQGYGAASSIIYGQPISTANARETRTTIDASISQMFSMKPGYVNDGGTHRIAILSRDSGGELDEMHGVSSSSVTYTTVNGLSATSGNDPGAMGGTILPYNGHWVAIWSGDGIGSIFMAESDDFASPSWGSVTTVISGLTADPVISAIATADGVLVAYTDLSGPTVDLVWAIGGPPSGSSHPLEGSVIGVTAVSGNLGARAYALGGSAIGSTGVQGSLSQRRYGLGGSAIGFGICQGNLSPRRYTIAGQPINGYGAMAGQLSARSYALLSTAVGLSLVSGNLESREYPLNGLISGWGALTGNLFHELVLGMVKGGKPYTADWLQSGEPYLAKQSEALLVPEIRGGLPIIESGE